MRFWKDLLGSLTIGMDFDSKLDIVGSLRTLNLSFNWKKPVKNGGKPGNLRKIGF